MNAFHIIGGLTAIWAVLVAILGITRENFPGNKEKIVGALSVLFVVGAISSAIITSANESGESHSSGEDHGVEQDAGESEDGSSESHP